ncbi:MAG: hypothetical protein AAGJ10_07240 [Bacteroidota bacterium]
MHERDEQELQRFGEQLKHVPTPDPGEVYWDGYYSRLLGRMHPVAEPAQQRPTYRWVWQLATAMLLVVGGVVVGRYSSTPDPAPRVAVGAEQPEVRAQAVRMLGRAEVLLLGLAHAEPSLDDPAMAQIERKRALANDLLTDMNALRDALDPLADGLLLDVLDELEVLLLEIANLDGVLDTPGVERVQRGIEEGSALRHVQQSQIDLNQALPIS